MAEETMEQKLNRLPEFVAEFLEDPSTVDIIIDIRKKYELEESQLDAFNDVLYGIVFKEKKIEETQSEIRKGLNFDEEKSKEISLIILCEILYPIKDYFPGIEDAIKLLGGEIPKIIPKKQVQELVDEEKIEERQRQTIKEQIEAEAKMEKVVKADIKSLLKEYTPAGDQEIGQNPIEVPSVALPVKPKIKYWIECYQEATGYGWNTNMERVKFIYHNKNTRGMNEEERRQLGLVLKSLDEETPLVYLEKARRIDFAGIEE